jgi:hypothetical protein
VADAVIEAGSVVLTGSTLTGTRAAFVGTQWAVGVMGATGALLMVAIGVALPRV